MRTIALHTISALIFIGAFATGIAHADCGDEEANEKIEIRQLYYPSAA